MEFHVTPILFAVDPGAIVAVVFVVISVLGWIINLVKEKGKNQAVRPAEPPDRPVAHDERFQQEIDVFLQQVGGGRRPRFEEDVDIEVVPEDELLERQAEERRHRKLSSIEDRHVKTSELGEGVRSHVEVHMLGDSIKEQVQRDVGNRIDAFVEAGFGDSIAAETTTARRPRLSVDPRDIVHMLRDPEGVRKAIIVNEILARRPRR